MATMRPLLWKSRFRPWAHRLFLHVAPFLRDALGFASALGLGWEGSWLLFGRNLHPALYIVFCLPTGATFAAVRAVLLRRAVRPLPAPWRGWLISGATVFVLMFSLHFVRHPHKRFAFMKDHPVKFELEPTLPTYTEAVYTYPVDTERLFEDAKHELSAKGYRIEENERQVYADKSFFYETPGSTWLAVDSVSVEKGRATGKHFWIDGDTIDLDKAQSWVTVSVAQPELLPIWLKLFVP